MSEIETLEEFALSDSRWDEAARGVVDLQWELSEQVEIETELLARNVLSGAVKVGELRGGVLWASALDREAVEVYGSDLAEGAQQYERTARRIMHHSGRMALAALKTSRKLSDARVRLNNTGRVIG
jgi:hypothetical protein